MAETLDKRRERNALQAQKVADERREKASGGVGGWVAERSGKWSLEDADTRFMAAHTYYWNSLCDYGFRAEIEGWEHLPDPPCLLIGIHSGAPLPWDAWTLGMQWWRHFGPDRMLHGTAHDALTAAPGLGWYLRKLGVLPAAPDSIAAALAARRDVLLYPGGEVDSLRPWTQRDQAILAGRTGFVKMAIRARVPIVPVATVGGADAMPVLFSGKRVARALKLDQTARLKMFPVAISLPWGLNTAILPEIPFPTKIRTAFQEPVEVARDPARARDEDYVEQIYERVQASIQEGMDVLARRRRLPLFG